MRALRLAARAATLASAVALGACNFVLGLDDLPPLPADASSDAGSDAAIGAAPDAQADLGLDGGVADAAGAMDADAPGADATTVDATPTEFASCANGLACGTIDCCDTRPIPAGTYRQGRATTGPQADVCDTWATIYCSDDEQPQFIARLSPFALDTFEVTVGRFRNFVAAYAPTMIPAGAGANPQIPGSGWDPSWNASLAPDRATLVANLKCGDASVTWTDDLGDHESLPINCVDWFTAFAFCAWDGGRLPTESEWEYAASGTEDRALPWEIPPDEAAPDLSHAIYGDLYSGPGAFEGIAPVGTVPDGAGKWGNMDLAGNVWEWVLDWYAPYPTSTSTDYAQLEPTSSRILRGGGFYYSAVNLRVNRRGSGFAPTFRENDAGIRCARAAPP